MHDCDDAARSGLSAASGRRPRSSGTTRAHSTPSRKLSHPRAAARSRASSGRSQKPTALPDGSTRPTCSQASQLLAGSPGPVEPALDLEAGRGHPEEEPSGQRARPTGSVDRWRRRRCRVPPFRPGSIRERATVVRSLPPDGTLAARDEPRPPAPMPATSHDPERIPVVIASGQSIERDELVTAVDLMERAVRGGLGRRARPAGRDRAALGRQHHDPDRPRPGHRAGPPPRHRGHAACEVTTIGGNTPQWLVSRAATDIAGGALSVTLIAGAEAIRSSRARRAAGRRRPR